MELRPYQKEAKTAVLSQWEQGNSKTLLVLPTGCGKTIVFAKIAEDRVRNGERVLILAHRGELLEQAADKILNACGLGCAVEKAGRKLYRLMVSYNGRLCTVAYERKATCTIFKRLFQYDHN